MAAKKAQKKPAKHDREAEKMGLERGRRGAAFGLKIL